MRHNWPLMLQILILTILGVGVLIFGDSSLGLGEGAKAIGGGFLGAAISQCGTLLVAVRAEKRAADEKEVRKKNIRELISAELVNAAAGYIDAYRFFKAGNAPGMVKPEFGQLKGYLPRSMAFTFTLGTEILALSPEAVASIVHLRSNMEQTGADMQSCIDHGSSADWPTMVRLYKSVCHDMGLLKVCFDRIAPDAAWQHNKAQPELFTMLLGRLSQEDNHIV